VRGLPNSQGLSLTSHIQNGLLRVEFGIDSTGKVALGRAFASADSNISRCHWFISTVDRSEQSPLPEECIRNGWRSIAFGQPVSGSRLTSATPHLTGDCRGIGELIVRITYADALSKEEAHDLVRMNEETVRLITEAATKVYLVNIISMCTSISIAVNPFIHSCSTSQVHPCLGPRRRVPAISRPCQELELHNSQWAMGEGPQGYRELVWLRFILFSSSHRTLEFAALVWQIN
jgi:hypothetical protein